MKTVMFFISENCDDKTEILGECYGRERRDREDVIFVEVEE